MTELMNQWQQERQERAQQFATLVEAVRRELGPGWTASGRGAGDIYGDAPTYLTKGDVRLHLSRQDYGSAAERGRLEVSGSYHHLTEHLKQGYRSLRDYGLIKYDEKEPRIGVAVARGALAIAKDIQRRLLPDVERMTAGMKEKAAEALAGQELTRINADRLAAAVHGRVLEDRITSHEAPVYANNGVYLSARVAGDSVRFEHFTVDIEGAIAIGRVLAEMAARKEEA
jgi:hypothetical protein